MRKVRVLNIFDVRSDQVSSLIQSGIDIQPIKKGLKEKKLKNGPLAACCELFYLDLDTYRMDKKNASMRLS